MTGLERSKVRKSRRRASGGSLRSATQKPLHVRLVPRGRALLIIGVVTLLAAYLFRRSELLYVGSLLVGLPLVAVVALRFRNRLMGISRRFAPSIAEVGRPVTVSVEVRNLGSTRTWESVWRDEWPWAPFGNESTRLPPLSRWRGVSGRGSTTVSYIVEPPRRGIFDIGPFVVEVSDPFLVARGEAVAGGTQKLVVTPRVVALPVTGLSITSEDGAARAQQKRNDGGGDDLMTREYRHGDPMRRVHWKASARHGELMVRLEEQRSHARARILVDTRRAGYRDVDSVSENDVQSESFEWVVGFTASLSLHLQRTGFTVEVIETGYRQVAQPEQPQEFLGSLASVELVDGSHQQQLFSLPPGSGRSLGSVFAVLSDAEPHTVERLVTQRAQFETAIAFVVNPLNELALGPLHESGWTCVLVRSTDDLADVWRAAAELREANRARG